MGEWRPIETAPQDGTRVLLAPATWTPEGVVTAYRGTSLWWIENADVRGNIRAFTPPEEDDTHWPFTHWMPLPAPPKETAERDRQERRAALWEKAARAEEADRQKVTAEPVSDRPQYQCARCQWFDGDTPYGYCRKEPPRIAGGGLQTAAWPLVFNPTIQWCGQFSPKRHAPWTATTTTEGATK